MGREHIIPMRFVRGFVGKGKNVLSDSGVAARTTKSRRRPQKCRACKTFGYLPGPLCASCVDKAQIRPLIAAVVDARKDLMAKRTDDINVLWAAQAALSKAIDKYVSKARRK